VDLAGTYSLDKCEWQTLVTHFSLAVDDYTQELVAEVPFKPCSSIAKLPSPEILAVPSSDGALQLGHDGIGNKHQQHRDNHEHSMHTQRLESSTKSNGQCIVVEEEEQDDESDTLTEDSRTISDSATVLDSDTEDELGMVDFEVDSDSIQSH
jgi:hypothetical protein